MNTLKMISEKFNAWLPVPRCGARTCLSSLTMSCAISVSAAATFENISCAARVRAERTRKSAGVLNAPRKLHDDDKNRRKRRPPRRHPAARIFVAVEIAAVVEDGVLVTPPASASARSTETLARPNAPPANLIFQVGSIDAVVATARWGMAAICALWLSSVGSALRYPSDQFGFRTWSIESHRYCGPK